MSEEQTLPKFPTVWEFYSRPMGWLVLKLFRRPPFISLAWKRNPNW